MLCNGTGRSDRLCHFSHNEARIQPVGSCGDTGVADVGGRGLHVQLIVEQDVTVITPSGGGKNITRTAGISA